MSISSLVFQWGLLIDAEYVPLGSVITERDTSRLTLSHTMTPFDAPGKQAF